MARVRRQTFEEDIGQNSWTGADEYRRWADDLQLGPGSSVVEVGSGAGGPALFLASLTGCRVLGLDNNPDAAAIARARAAAAGLADRVAFEVADGNGALPVHVESVDAIVCIDAVNHFADRPSVLREWHRVLRPGGRLLYTDPVVVTGPVTGAEFAARSCIGPMVYVPPGANERWLDEAGFAIVRAEDLTAAVARIAARWWRAREHERSALLASEGAESFAAMQGFLRAVGTLAAARRLSRHAYLARKSRHVSRSALDGRPDERDERPAP